MASAKKEEGKQVQRERLMWIAALALGELAGIDGDGEAPELLEARNALSRDLGRDPFVVPERVA